MAITPSLLSANELTLSFGHQNLLEGVTLAVAPGEKVGLVGRNGCGKTTLLKILAGDMHADSGEISRRRELRIGYLPQEFELDDTKTVLQNIEVGAADLIEWLHRYETGQGTEAELGEILHNIEHADGWNLQSRIRAEADALGVPPMDTLVAKLSGGEKRRVALCRALASQPDLLLLDEPTNHLDAETIRWLETCLHDFPGAVIFVTHDRYFLDVIATRVVEIDGGRAYSHPGNYTAYLESKAIRQGIAEQSERARQRFLKGELAWVRSGARAQRTKAQHRMRAYYVMAGQEAPPEERDMDLLIPPALGIGNTVVDFENAAAKVGEEPNERWLFRHLNLSFKPGQCTGVIGRNGVGKTTLLRMCLGERAPDEGTAKIARQVKFNYVDQSRMQLDENKTVLEQISDGGETVLFGEERLSARGYLRRFLFADDRANEPISKLSGGERARLMLAKVLKRGGNMIVLDEPTNDLDLPSLRMLEEALVDFAGTVLVVSHDRYFLDRICDQIISFEEGGVVVTPGNYSYYLDRKKERDARDKGRSETPRPAPGRTAEGTAPSQTAPARTRKLSFKEQRELDGLEAAVLAAETRATVIEATLADPKFFSTRAAEATGFIAELEKTKAEVTRLYARWEQLDAIGK